MVDHRPMATTLNRLAVFGLMLGAVFGLAGTVIEQAALRGVLWGIDGAGLVMAACLLALKYLRRANDPVAAGFLVFAVGEGVMMSGAAATLTDSLPSFAAGSALWATALLLVSIPGEFALPVRAVGVASAILFATTALRMLAGAALSPLSAPLPFFAYPFLVLTFIGWGWTLLRENVAHGPSAPEASGAGGQG
jgi:hypothetical protein